MRWPAWPHDASPHRRHRRRRRLDLRGSALHRVPSPQGVRPADPRGRAEAPHREARHADSGRRPDPARRVARVLRSLEVQDQRADRRLRDAVMWPDRLPRRLHQVHPPALARPRRALEAAVAHRCRGGDRLPREPGRPASPIVRTPPGDRLANPARAAVVRPRLPRHRRCRERRKSRGRRRRSRRGHGDHLPLHVHDDGRSSLHPLEPPPRTAEPLEARPRDRRRRADRGRGGIPLVQRLPGGGLHGRHGLDGARRRDGGVRDRDEGRGAAPLYRRLVRHRGGLRDHPGLHVQVPRATRLPDGAHTPPLRDEGLVRHEDHGALLDPAWDPLRDRLRAVLPLLPELPRVKVLVYGLARSGVAAAAALEARGDEVVRVDSTLGNEDDVRTLDDVELVVKNPGVPGERPLVVEARRRGIPVWSEVELGWRLLVPRPFIGVTGTKGKTTTSELLGEIFRAAGREVVVAGNVGRPLTAVEVSEDAWIVVELSSFQLEDVHELALEVAVLLNLEPDHLDRHGTFERYRAAKLRIFERARQKVVPRGLGLDGIEFSADDPLPAEPWLPGRHNRANAAAATAVARAVGIIDDAVAEALREFRGVPHRLELVRERDGVRWINDSIATNTLAARAGVEAFDAPVRLILGGRAKGEDYNLFARSLPARVAAVYLVGEASDELASAFEAAARSFERAGTIERAVGLAASAAHPGDVVLLSPACASYDQFANFERRGEEFRRLVSKLP